MEKNKKIKKEEVQDEESALSLYEIGYILNPSYEENDISNIVLEMKKSISSFGATHKTEGAPSLITLAYEMSKVVENKKSSYQDGYFGWFIFESPKNVVKQIETLLREHKDIIRYLLVKVTKEYAEKPPLKRIKSERRKDSPEDENKEVEESPEVETVKEDVVVLDEKIDAMIEA